MNDNNKTFYDNKVHLLLFFLLKTLKKREIFGFLQCKNH